MKTFTVIVFREIRAIWIRLLIIFAIMNILIYTGGGTDQLMAPAILFGLLMGVDFGTRDKTTGFDLTLLTVPLSQRWISLIRFLVRFALLVGVADVLLNVMNPETIYSRSVDLSLFWLFIMFFSTTSASLCSRKTIIAICLGIGLVMGWYLLLIGVASLEWLNSPLLLIALIPSTLTPFCLIVSLVMLCVTLVIVSGGFKPQVNSRYLISMRQTVFTWLGGALICAICLLLIPVYYARQPLENATDIRITHIDGPNRIAVEASMNSFPLGTWVVDENQKQRVSDLNGAYRMVSSSDGKYMLRLCSDYRNQSEEIYLIDGTKKPGMDFLRSLDARIYYGYMRKFYFEVSPQGNQALFTLWTRKEPNHLLLADLHHPENDLTWQPPDMNPLDKVFALGWLTDTEFVSMVSKQNRIELWLGDGTGSAIKLWTQPEDLHSAVTTLKTPVCVWHRERKSVVMLFEPIGIIPENLSDSEQNSHGYLVIEVDRYGKEIRFDPGIDKSMNLDLLDPQCGNRLVLISGAVATLIDLETTETYPTEMLIFDQNSLSPDCRYCASWKSQQGEFQLSIYETITGDLVCKKSGFAKGQHTWVSSSSVVYVSFPGDVVLWNIETDQTSKLFSFNLGGIGEYAQSISED